MPPSCLPLRGTVIIGPTTMLSSSICLSPETVNHIHTICSINAETTYLLNFNLSNQKFLDLVENRNITT
jgi:hypothetical protein